MPIAMSKAEWARIVKWTDPNKENPETARQREYVRRMDEISAHMTRDWPNSVENVNKRNEEQRRARIEVAEQANSKFYKRYVRRKREEQERLMHSARDTIFKNKDAPKLLLSAVIETTVQKERGEQLKFNAERKKEAEEEKKRDDEEIIRKAKEWYALMDTRRQRLFEANKQYQRELLDQAHEVEERKRKEYETELAYQKMDNIKAQEQMAAIAKFEADFKAEEKARIFADMERAKEELDARRAENAARDKLDDRLIQVLQNSRARVEAKRKKTEKELKDEKLRILEQISHRLETGDAAREAAEQAAYEKAVQEKEKVTESRLQDQKRKKEEFVKMRKDARAQFLADEKQHIHELNTRRQWELMNRFKNVELYEDYQEYLRKEKARKIKEFKEDTLRLWKERDERDARERAETRYFYGELALKKLRAADNKLLTHAQALIDEAKQHGRPDHALKKAVDRYCNLYRLYPMPPLPTSMQEHFGPYAPWDGSAPDVEYREPPAPPPDRGPDAPDEPEPDPVPDAPPGKRDGMQAMDKPGPSKPVEKVQEETAKDYRRAGRANGLQRRPSEHDLKLPPVTVVPCQNPSCTCLLKE